MKICVLGTRGFPYIQGGVEKHCESLYPLFGGNCRFVVFRRRAYVTSNETYPNITFVDLPSTKIKGVEAVFHSFLATCYSVCCHPDIVHIHNIGPALFSPLLRLFGIKVVLTYHSPNYEHKKWGWFAKSVLRLSEKIALNASNAIIFVNKFQMEKYVGKVRKKSRYIPNGIPNTVPSLKTDYITQLGLVPQRYVLGVGRITPEKGFDCLVKAFARTKDEGFKLVIAGGVETESGYLKELKGLIASDRVVFTGYVYGEKLNQLYTHAALYVLSSYNEGFPLVLLEAMSYGLEVLASDIPAAHLIELPAEDYFEKGNDGELAAKLTDKLACRMKRKYAMEEYDWDIIAGQVEKVYESLYPRTFR